MCDRYRPAFACLAAATATGLVVRRLRRRQRLGDRRSSTPPRAERPSPGPRSSHSPPRSSAGGSCSSITAASCHTLDAAGTVGNVGPNLDDIAVNHADVLHAIRTGGGRHAKGQGTGPSGNMPRNLVTGKDAQEVAAFVAANASGSSTP